MAACLGLPFTILRDLQSVQAAIGWPVINLKVKHAEMIIQVSLLFLFPSHPAKEMVMDASVELGVIEADHTVGLTQNLNGKASSWTFEEFIDIGVHSKSPKLSLDSISAGNCNQNLNDAATIPSSPKLAFEEDGTVNSLTKPIDASSGNPS